jgi:hypothetical protein
MVYLLWWRCIDYTVMLLSDLNQMVSSYVGNDTHLRGCFHGPNKHLNFMEVGITCCSFEMHGPSNCSVYEVCRMYEFINIAEENGIMWFMFCLFETAVSRLQLYSGRRIWKCNSGYTHPYFWQLKRNMLWDVVEWSSVPNTLMQSCILKQICLQDCSLGSSCLWPMGETFPVTDFSQV